MPEKASSLVKIQNAGRVRIDGHDRQVEAGDLLLLPAEALKTRTSGPDIWVFIALTWIVATAWLLFF